MKLQLYQSLMLLSWYQYISCNRECGPRINVSGAEGGGATLPVTVPGQIKDITWTISGNHFATTIPSQPIYIRDDQYEGRLRSETNGSLTLTDLTNQEQGIYTASVLLKSVPQRQCQQLYYLQVYKTLTSEDILIHLNVTLSETHNGTCNITGTLSCAVIGSDVTLTWNNTNSPGTEVTNHTLRVYNAQSHVTYSCTARNPISEASRTAHIPCNRDDRMAGNPTRPWGIIPILIAVGVPVAFLVLAVLAVRVIFCCRSKRKKDQHKPVEMEGQTLYAQVQKPNRETVSGSGTADRTANSSVSMYSEVQLPKGGRAGQGNPTQGEKIETVYSEVTLPAQGNQSGSRNENPYTEGQTGESCSDSAQNIQVANNTKGPSNNNPSRPSYNQLV